MAILLLVLKVRMLITDKVNIEIKLLFFSQIQSSNFKPR
jgi:hypothetical protein